jgi:calcium-dependent protein kinase
MLVPEMEVVSLFLKDLIRRMLKPAEERITLDQIYQHPWMNVKIHKSTLKVDFRIMANFSKFSKIKTIAATFIASQLAAQDIAKYEKVFQELDENHDGFLSLEELHHYMIHNKNSTNQVSFQELKNLIDFVDTDKNGKINYT